MSSLRRTAAAGFTLDDAVTLDRVQQEGEALLAPLDSLFRQHPAYRIQHPRVDALCRNGNPFTVRQPLPEGLYRATEPCWKNPPPGPGSWRPSPPPSPSTARPRRWSPAARWA